MKTSHQRQSTLEREVRDCRLNAEKYQLAMQAQLEEFQRQTGHCGDQVGALQNANQLLTAELTALRTENEYLTDEVKQNKALIQQLQQQLDAAEERNQEMNVSVRRKDMFVLQIV